MTDPPIEASIERCWREVRGVEEAFDSGAIDRVAWHQRMAKLVVSAYVAGADLRAESGFTGTEADWRHARGLVAEAIERPGTFLDIGCANGLLMKSVHAWCAERGLDVQPYGLDIAPELVELARSRVRHWGDRIFEGNAFDWIPPRRFDVVRTGLEYVPRTLGAELVRHLLDHVVAPGGTLLVGPYTEERDETRTGPSTEERLRDAGLAVRDVLERPHGKDARVVRRLARVRANEESPNAG